MSRYKQWKKVTEKHKPVAEVRREVVDPYALRVLDIWSRNTQNHTIKDMLGIPAYAGKQHLYEVSVYVEV